MNRGCYPLTNWDDPPSRRTVIVFKKNLGGIPRHTLRRIVPEKTPNYPRNSRCQCHSLECLKVFLDGCYPLPVKIKGTPRNKKKHTYTPHRYQTCFFLNRSPPFPKHHCGARARRWLIGRCSPTRPKICRFWRIIP